MGFTTKIRQTNVVDGEQAAVVATINHAPNGEINPQEVMASLQSQSGNYLTPVSGSFSVIASEPTRTTISGFMSLSKHVMPFPGQQAMEEQGFKAMASNMFLDSNEKIWSVKDEDGQKVCVRANTVDNPEELQGLLAKCTSAIGVGQDPVYFEAVANAKTEQQAPVGGTLVTFVSESMTKFGVVLGSVFETEDENSYTGRVHVLPINGDAEEISDAQIVAAAANVQWEEPADLESQAMGNIGKSQKDQLVDYYRKVFGHGKEFFAEWEKRIRGHAYA